MRADCQEGVEQGADGRMCRHVCLVSWLLSRDLVIYSSFGSTEEN